MWLILSGRHTFAARGRLLYYLVATYLFWRKNRVFYLYLFVFTCICNVNRTLRTRNQDPRFPQAETIPGEVKAPSRFSRFSPLEESLPGQTTSPILSWSHFWEYKKNESLGYTSKRMNLFVLQLECCGSDIWHIENVDIHFCWEIETTFWAHITLLSYRQSTPNVLYIVFVFIYFRLARNVKLVPVELDIFALIEVDNFCEKKTGYFVV